MMLLLDRGVRALGVALDAFGRCGKALWPRAGRGTCCAAAGHACLPRRSPGNRAVCSPSETEATTALLPVASPSLQASLLSFPAITLRKPVGAGRQGG